jgi:hypothetical protein
MIPKHNTQKLFPRKLQSEVTAFLDTPEILLLIGARQVGKTSILYLIIEELKRKGVRDNAIYFTGGPQINNHSKKTYGQTVQLYGISIHYEYTI